MLSCRWLDNKNGIEPASTIPKSVQVNFLPLFIISLMLVNTVLCSGKDISLSSVSLLSFRFIRSRFRTSSPVPDQMSPPVPSPLEEDYRLADNCVTYFVAGLFVNLHLSSFVITMPLIIYINMLFVASTLC